MNRIKFFHSEQGQSLVLIAAVMVGLLAMAGLAIDGGNFFLQRRNTQNAVDAIALAGTRVLAKAICSEPGVTDASVSEAVSRYAQLNGINDLNSLTVSYVNRDETVLGAVGDGSVPLGATGVSVEAANPIPTYFLPVVGISEFTASASAMAMTGPPLTAGGLRPIGIPLPLMMDLETGDSFTISFGNCTQPDECIVSYTGGNLQHRGMVNLAYTWNQGEEDADWPRAIDPSGSANVLKEWMANGYPNGVPFYADEVGGTYGDYIHAKPGRNSSVIGEAPVGEVVLVPIFDDTPHYDEIPAPKAPQASQGGGYYYHIVGFMAFEVTGANQGAGTITGTYVNAIIGSGQVSSAEGTGFGEGNACLTHLQTVNLWR
jgi:hypothetical protein